MGKRSLLSVFGAIAGVGLLSVHCGGSGKGSGGEEGDGGTSSAASSGGGNTATTTSSGIASSSGGASSGTAASSSGTATGTTSGTATSSGVTTSSGSTSGIVPPDGDGGTGGPQSVLQRGNDLLRQATFVEPGFTTTAVTTMAPDTAFNGNATFPANGSMQNQGAGSVLYLEGGPAGAGCPAGATGCVATNRPAGNGIFIAFPALGANPNVVAFDEITGQAVWTAHLTQKNGGGDGLRGTPVIDPASRRLFAVTGPNPHTVHAISIDTGVEVTTGGWPVTLSNTTLTYNGLAFNSGGENQHGALLLMNNILYIPFGGEYGDCGESQTCYSGWVAAVNITNAMLSGWATQSGRSGIWGAGGPASDGSTSVFVATGDTNGGIARAMSDSQEMVRLSGMATLTRNAANIYVPPEWQNWDRPKDLDFGASTPSYVNLPAGSTPSALLVAPAKAGRLYFLDGTNLSQGMSNAGSAGGELVDMVVSGTTGETVYTSPTIYSSASGLHAAINVGGGVNGTACPAGSVTTQEAIISTLITPGATPIAKIAWCASVMAGWWPHELPADIDDDRRREGQRDRVVHRRHPAGRCQRRYRSEAFHDDRRRLYGHPEHELPYRREEPDRGLGPGAPLFVVARRNVTCG